ncbi:hypothetical protein C8R44DRAFT_876181 [Mycena epipterygia]|nr:hypothetical protein C8R44DRAFT_876181 [Mycena epipterygia]
MVATRNVAPLMSISMMRTPSGWQPLRHRLAELDAQISILEEERETIRRKMRRISYPVLELPPELTSEIFLLCLPDLPSDPSPLEAPLLLLEICTAWREIALRTPALWASFNLRDILYGKTLAFQGEMGGKRLLDWLRRAGSAPLDLKIRHADPQPGTSPESHVTPPPATNMFLELCKRAPQWHDVDLTIPFQDLALECIKLALEGKLNTLKRLSLHVWERGSPLSITVFSQAPNLQQVSLTRLRLDNIILPWTQLTSLTITAGFSLQDCVQVLQLSPRLTFCRFDSVTGELDNQTLLSPLPNLQSLYFDCEHSVQILRVLTLPGLTNLGLPCSLEDDELVRFLSRSSPVRLCKVLVCGAYTFVSDALPLMSALVDLEMNNLFPDEATIVLQALLDSAATATHLQSISINVHGEGDNGPDELNYHVLLGAVVALKDRALKSFRLTWVQDSFGRLPDTSILDRLWDLVEDEGMHIYLGTSDRSWM